MPKAVAPILKTSTEDPVRETGKDVYQRNDTNHQASIVRTVDGDDIRGCLVDIDVIGRDESLGEDESLFERGLIDSLGITILITHLEKTYPIRVSEEDLLPDNFDTISAIVHYVNSKLQDSARD